MDPRALLKDLQSHTLSLTHEVSPYTVKTYRIQEDVDLLIHEDDSGGVATLVWQAVLVQCRYLSSHGLSLPGEGGGAQGEVGTVVELGAGTGFVGLYMAKYLGAKRVHLTDMDMPKVMGVLEKNVQANSVEDACVVSPLDWRAPEEWEHQGGEEIDHIVVCECVYNGKMHAALLQTLVRLAGENTIVHVCFAERNPEGEAAFFVKAKEVYGFDVWKIDDAVVDSCKSGDDQVGDNDANVYLFMMRKTPQESTST